MNKNKLLISLLKVMLLVLIAITAFEYAKYVIFPGLTVFYSHIIGIGFGVMIVGIAAYMVQKKQEKLLIEKIDETEKRMQFEASLRNAEEKYRKLFIESMDGVCQTTLDGVIVEANQAFCDMLGGDAGGIIGGSITRFYNNPEDRIKFRDAVEKNKGVKNYEIVQTRVDGRQIICSVSSSYCYSPTGEKTGYLTIVRDITDRKRMEEEILAMSLRDQMTELYNRRGFITLAEQQIRAANRAKKAMLLTFIDSDGLKGINDTFGHEEGDRALIDTADVLRRTFRESDVIARLGGDEFAILSIDAAVMNPDDFSVRLQQHIAEFNARASRPYKLAMSWGTAVYDPESPLSLDELMSAADERMYAQKKAKPNREI